MIQSVFLESAVSMNDGTVHGDMFDLGLESLAGITELSESVSAIDMSMANATMSMMGTEYRALVNESAEIILEAEAQGFWQKIIGWFKMIWQRIKEFLVGAWQKIKAFFAGVYNWLSRLSVNEDKIIAANCPEFQLIFKRMKSRSGKIDESLAQLKRFVASAATGDIKSVSAEIATEVNSLKDALDDAEDAKKEFEEKKMKAGELKKIVMAVVKQAEAILDKYGNDLKLIGSVAEKTIADAKKDEVTFVSKEAKYGDQDVTTYGKMSTGKKEGEGKESSSARKTRSIEYRGRLSLTNALTNAIMKETKELHALVVKCRAIGNSISSKKVAA